MPSDPKCTFLMIVYSSFLYVILMQKSYIHNFTGIVKGLNLACQLGFASWNLTTKLNAYLIIAYDSTVELLGVGTGGNLTGPSWAHSLYSVSRLAARGYAYSHSWSLSWPLCLLYVASPQHIAT